MATKHVITTGTNTVHRHPHPKDDLESSVKLSPDVTIDLKTEELKNKKRQEIIQDPALSLQRDGIKRSLCLAVGYHNSHLGTKCVGCCVEVAIIGRILTNYICMGWLSNG